MARVDTHAPGDFNWYDLMTPDMAASKKFYAGLFGWTASDQPSDGGGPYALFEKEGDPVAGIGEMNEQMKSSGMPPVWNAYVCVAELEPALEKIGSQGGRTIFGPIDVMDHGRLAYFQDPEGAVLALWQAKQHIGSCRRHEAGTVCWTELATRDISAATEFYTSVFGWEDVDNPHGPPAGYRTLKNGARDIGGILQMTDEWGDMPAHWSLYFEVDDCQASAEQLTGLGGSVKFGPFEAPVGHIAVCADDVGAHFYLMQLSEEIKAAR